MVISPVVGAIRPAIILKIVDFPQPEVPTRLTNSPLYILMFTSVTALVTSVESTLEKLFETSLSFNSIASLIISLLLSASGEYSS